MRLFFSISLFFCSLSFGQSIYSLDSILELEGAAIQSNSHELIPLVKQLKQQAKKEKDDLAIAKANSILSLASYYAGNYDENKKYSLEAIQHYQKANHQALLAKEYGELGFRMKHIDLTEALNYMQKGLRIAEKNNYKQALVSLYNNYGTLQHINQVRDSALLFFNKSIEVCLQIGDSIGLTYAYNNIGNVQIELKEFSNAQQNFEKSLFIRQKRADSYGIADSYAYFGDLYFAQKEYAKAITYFQQSLKIAEENLITNLMHYNFRLLASSYELLNDYENALFYANRRQSFGDSLLNIQTNEKIIEYQTRFETAEKEKKILEQEIITKKKQSTIILLFVLLIAIVLISLLIYRALRLRNKQQQQEFELKEAIAQIETQNQLKEQRLVISRDLHDNIGAQLTFIISSIDTLKYAFKITDEKINSRLTTISSFTKDTITELRDTIWAMNHTSIDFEEIRTRISNFVEKAKAAQETITFDFQISENTPEISFTSVQGMNIYRIIQEAVNNSIKYAECSRIEIAVSSQNDRLYISAKDNGKGFDEENVEGGNGLRNMRKRASEINAQLEMISAREKGVEIQLVLNNKSIENE